MQSVTTKRGRKVKDDSNEQALLFVVFWVAVLVECIALYKRTYLLYGVARMFVVPVLLLRTFRSPAFRNVGFYFFLFLALSFIADAFTAYGNYTLGSIGLSLYTLSYICMGCWFQQLKNKSNSNILFITAVLLLSLLNTLWKYAPELHKQTFPVLIGTHSLVLIYIIYSVVNMRAKNNYSLFLFGVIAIVITNILYGIDILYYHQTLSWLDTLIGLGNGVYLFLLTKSVLRIERMLQVANGAVN